MKRIFDLLQNLVDLETIEMIVEDDGVKQLADFLDSQSAQIRKYDLSKHPESSFIVLAVVSVFFLFGI